MVNFLNNELTLLPGQLVVSVQKWKYVLFVQFNFGRSTFVSRREINRRMVLRWLQQESSPETASERHYEVIQKIMTAIKTSSIQNDRVKCAYSYLEQYDRSRVNTLLLSRALNELLAGWTVQSS
jgi:hypothetical protein